jgi:hypothetical protein
MTRLQTRFRRATCDFALLESRSPRTSTVRMPASWAATRILTMMKRLTFTVEPGKFKINEYPDAAWLGAIEGDEVTVLKSFALHQHDLESCEQALQICGPLMDHKDDPGSALQVKVLWTGILALYVKCFATGARQGLCHETVFPDPEDRKAHQYFKDMRDKHLIHDVNVYSDAHVGVVVNPQGTSPKVADVVSHIVEAFPSLIDMQTVYNLVTGALTFVRTHRAGVTGVLRLMYERKPREELLEVPALTWTVPTAAQLKKGRQRPMVEKKR